jgi:hypothetical protein
VLFRRPRPGLFVAAIAGLSAVFMLPA